MKSLVILISLLFVGCSTGIEPDLDIDIKKLLLKKARYLEELGEVREQNKFGGRQSLYSVKFKDSKVHYSFTDTAGPAISGTNIREYYIQKEGMFGSGEDAKQWLLSLHEKAMAKTLSNPDHNKLLKTYRVDLKLRGFGKTGYALVTKPAIPNPTTYQHYDWVLYADENEIHLKTNTLNEILNVMLL